MDLRAELGTDGALIGVVHLPPLPGAPRYEGPREAIRDRALADAQVLVEGGFDGVLVENYGDVPFYPEDVPDHVVAELTATVQDVRGGVDVPVGVNVLRNDATAALSAAAAAGGSFVRVNVHQGVAATDQGIVEGRAHETIRLREGIDADVAVLADLSVKHATSLDDRPIEDQAVETVERGLADGLIVTGPSTGEAVAADDLQSVVDRRDEAGLDVPVLAGSGVTPETVDEVLAVADGAIVGTAVKAGGVTANPVDVDRVEALVVAAGRASPS